ncbi:MAG TPA: ATP phosphoribosyltransferase [Alphaproteobacteria bacterium]|nr:ATP phosphoribosyltransferase [Alphaproteobacteria bacterium]
MTQNPLRLVIPSKGRLQQPVIDFLAACGFVLERASSNRAYTMTVAGTDDVIVDLAAASEVPGMLAEGRAHLGITGIDLVNEMLGGPGPALDGASLPGGPMLVVKLGFGRANLEVAVPRAWIDVETMRDVCEVAHQHHVQNKSRIRVATKYVRLTRKFLSEAQLTDYRIVESAGATEAAPASGLAEIVVDISSTGATMAANHLKTLSDGRILSSEAALFAAPPATVTWSAKAMGALERLIRMARARLAAQRHKLVRASGRVQDANALTRELETLGVTDVVQTVETATGTTRLDCTASARQVFKLVQTLQSYGLTRCAVENAELLFLPGDQDIGAALTKLTSAH